MATIRKRGKKWQVMVRRDGYPCLSKTLTARADAHAWARDTERAVDRGELPTNVGDLKKGTVGVLLRRYSEQITPRKKGAEAERYRIGSMLRHEFAETPLNRLTSSAIADYRDMRLRVVSSDSVRRELVILHHCLEIARKDWGVPIIENPVSRVTKPTPSKPRTRRLEAGEGAVLIEALSDCRNPLVKEVFLFALYTGMRRGEVLSLVWKNVDLTDRTAHLPDTKNGEERTVPLSPSAAQLLAARKQALSTPYDPSQAVFPITGNAMRLAWERAKARTGIEDLRFHDLRHEAISRFFEIGLNVPEVSLISGHKDPRMLARYTQLRAADISRKLAHAIEDLA